MTIDTDITFMRHALRLGQRNLGQTWPNPSVGCVIVQDGQIIARGWTGKGGRPHAETMALEAAGDKARGATLYVTLEPCAHHGKTGPCAEAIVTASISRVVVACTDPDPRVSGQGIALLKKAGIEVTEGVCEAEAHGMHAGFFARIQKNRPFIALKTATSLDGKIALANGESQWITGEAARAYGQFLRSQFDAILTGSGTVLADNPKLTCRLPGQEDRSPLRIVLDRELKMPLDAAILPCWIFTREALDTSEKAKALAQKGCKILPAPESAGGLDLLTMMATLAEEGITRLLVEAGDRLTTAFLKSGLIDELYWFQSPKLLGNDAKAVIALLALPSLGQAPKFSCIQRLPLGEDSLNVYRCLPASSLI